MHVSTELNLHPRQVAKPLHEIQSWRLPETGDLLALHRGVLAMFRAMGDLSQLELPVALEAAAEEGGSGLSDSEVVHGLLNACAEALDGYPHRLRIQRVAKQSPGHALQLERMRRSALDKIQSLRARVEFIRSGLDGLEEPAWIRRRAEASRVLQ